MLETSTEIEHTSSGIADELPPIEIDDVTRRWMRNASDEKAVRAGCRFDEERGQGVVDWIERYCNLWEGSKGPMKLVDWQYEATMRIFGWVKWSQRLDRWVRRFTKASVYIPKKNGKTPTAASWGLYLLAGDGEDGNHVFFAAADGLQARLAAKHVQKMIDASPELGEEIKTNLTEMKFTHVPTGSDARPISSGDKTAAKSKQGLNGCVIIDETHVVSQQFISESSIDRMGATRDEPLHIEVSTAGKDPDSYGRKQYEYGKAVERGEIEDQAFFFLCYEAPPDLTDEMLDADPVRWGKHANPTWGRLIHEEEYLADYNRSKRSVVDLADFKTFRLNQWQTSASPWLNAADWRACRGNYTEADLVGQTAFAALDLAKVRDMTALALAFPIDDKIKVKVYYFMPQAGIDRLAVKVPRVHDWVKRGLITVTSAQTTDYRVVKAKIAELVNKYNIWQLLYDDWNAEQLTQEIGDELGIERLAFGQNLKSFNEPMKDLEARILERTFEHDGNDVLDWQIGHTEVAERNANIMPAKPERDEHKKIDGVVAMIMACAAAIRYGGVWDVSQGL